MRLKKIACGCAEPHKNVRPSQRGQYRRTLRMKMMCSFERSIHAVLPNRHFVSSLWRNELSESTSCFPPAWAQERLGALRPRVGFIPGRNLMCGDCPEVLFLLHRVLTSASPTIGRTICEFFSASVEARSNSGMRMRKNSCFLLPRQKNVFCQSAGFRVTNLSRGNWRAQGAKND